MSKEIKSLGSEREEVRLKHLDILNRIIDKYIEEYGLKNPIDISLIHSNDNFKELRDELDGFRASSKLVLSANYEHCVLIGEYKNRGGGIEKEYTEKSKLQLSVLNQLIEEYGSDMPLAGALNEILEKIRKNHFPNQ